MSSDVRRSIRVIAFDLDGTLIDSRLDLAEAVNLTRSDLELPALEVETVLGMVGEGARTLLRRALGGAPAGALLERALARFLHHYDATCLRQTRPYPGIDELLQQLSCRWPLALVTNKPERFSRKIVDHLGWHARFEPLIGGDTLPTRKPRPEGLLAVCRRHAVEPAELLLVGDSPIDAASAAAAGAPFAFVEWGFGRLDSAAPPPAASSVDAAALGRWLLAAP